MISFLDVSKSYNRNKVRAVDNLTLTVKPGEIFGFLGPNGAGNDHNHQDDRRPAPARAGPGSRWTASTWTPERCKPRQITTYVPDKPGDLRAPDRPGVSELHRRRLRRAQGESALERIAKWLDIFELAQVLTNPIQSYSHGMKQKIVLIAALLPAPRVMVLDEPMVGLDPRAAHNMKELHAGTLRPGRDAASSRPTSWRWPKGCATASASSQGPADRLRDDGGA